MISRKTGMDATDVVGRARRHRREVQVGLPRDVDRQLDGGVLRDRDVDRGQPVLARGNAGKGRLEDRIRRSPQDEVDAVTANAEEFAKQN